MISEAVNGRRDNLVVDDKIIVNLFFLNYSFLSLVLLDLLFLRFLSTKLLDNLISGIDGFQKLFSDEDSIGGDLTLLAIKVDGIFSQ